MKNKTLENQKMVEKAQVVNVALPWWATLIHAGHAGSSASLNYYRHYHHCTECGCIMMCQFKGCKGPEMLCPECSGSQIQKNSPQGGSRS